MVGLTRDCGVVGDAEAIRVCGVNAQQHGVVRDLGDDAVDGLGGLGLRGFLDHGDNVGIGVLAEVAQVGKLNRAALVEIAYDVGLIVDHEGRGEVVVGEGDVAIALVDKRALELQGGVHVLDEVNLVDDVLVAIDVVGDRHDVVEIHLALGARLVTRLLGGLKLHLAIVARNHQLLLVGGEQRSGILADCGLADGGSRGLWLAVLLLGGRASARRQGHCQGNGNGHRVLELSCHSPSSLSRRSLPPGAPALGW